MSTPGAERCCAPARRTRTGARGTYFGRFGVAAQVVAVAALPKCPLCIAALLSLCGLSVQVTSLLAPCVRPLAIAAVVVSGWRLWLRRARNLEP